MNHVLVTNDVLSRFTKAVIEQYPNMPIYQFKPGQQEDAHELFANIMQIFQVGHQDVINPSNVNPPNLSLSNLFQGKTTTRIVCNTCRNVTSTTESFVDLSVDISKASDLRTALGDYFK